MLKIYPKVEEFVKESYGGKRSLDHFYRTVYWAKELKPDTDEAFCVAALAHDIERSQKIVPIDPETTKKTHYQDPDYLKNHSEASAEIVKDFLEKENVEKGFIDRVVHLISRHEVGGDDDQNLLKDADSISFLENNIDTFLSKHVEMFGKEAVQGKFDFMYNRITSSEGKKFAKPFYDDACKRLEAM
ncbi:MAG: DUF4202 family protein [Patescibacteria group bacterium]